MTQPQLVRSTRTPLCQSAISSDSKGAKEDPARRDRDYSVLAIGSVVTELCCDLPILIEPGHRYTNPHSRETKAGQAGLSRLDFVRRCDRHERLSGSALELLVGTGRDDSTGCYDSAWRRICSFLKNQHFHIRLSYLITDMEYAAIEFIAHGIKLDWASQPSTPPSLPGPQQQQS